MSKAKKTAPKKKQKKRADVVYVVERAAGFNTARPDPVFDPEDPDFDPEEFAERSSYVPVRAFADRAAAEACLEELEAEVRAAFPPVAFLTYEDLPGGAKKFAAALAALGLDPPKFGRNEYEHTEQFRKWWAEHAADLTPEQRAGIWKLFDDVRVYRVNETALED